MDVRNNGPHKLPQKTPPPLPDDGQRMVPPKPKPKPAPKPAPQPRPKPKPSKRDDEAMFLYKLHKGGLDMGFKKENSYVREECVSKYPSLVIA
jgi:hypothetical protein